MATDYALSAGVFLEGPKWDVAFAWLTDAIDLGPESTFIDLIGAVPVNL